MAPIPEADKNSNFGDYGEESDDEDEDAEDSDDSAVPKKAVQGKPLIVPV